jgi:c(7)-type cytochrome triheme protein
VTCGVAVACAALVAAAGGGRAAAPAPAPLAPPAPAARPGPASRPAATGFDHIRHAGQLIAAGHADVACAACHRTDAAGKLAGAPGHAACFTACHAPAPPPPPRGRRARAATISAEQRPVCLACHADPTLTALLRGERVADAVPYPPYRIDPEYALAISHAAHARVPRGCEACHAVPSDAARDADKAAAPRRRGPAHARCAPCHARPAAAAVPPMSSCDACHRAEFGPTTGPRQLRGRYPVTGRFSHRAHLSRMGRRRDCGACHAAAAAAAEATVPAPSMAACATCHDGKTAFSTVETTCRRCHAVRDEPHPDAPIDRPRFRHAQHAARGMTQQCGDCHRLDAAGRPRTVGADHRPCADAGCHAEEFGSTEATLCGTCHVGREPWRALHADPLPPAASEFAALFSHASHLPAGGAAPGCEQCHPGGGATRSIAGGHAACAGGACHAPDPHQGAPPRLGACDACHRLDDTRATTAAQSARRWSVRARFRHDTHTAATGDGTPAATCEQCHTDVRTAATAAAITPPTKPRCAPCHDGHRAFKMTGHSCARCHGAVEPGRGAGGRPR